MDTDRQQNVGRRIHKLCLAQPARDNSPNCLAPARTATEGWRCNYISEDVIVYDWTTGDGGP